MGWAGRVKFRVGVDIQWEGALWWGILRWGEAGLELGVGLNICVRCCRKGGKGLGLGLIYLDNTDVTMLQGTK